MIEEPLDGIDAWLNYFSQCPIHLLSTTNHELTNALQRIDDIGANQLTEILSHDAMATMLLFRFAQQQRSKHLHSEVTTITRAVVLCGLSPSVEHLCKAPIVNTQLSKYPAALYRVLQLEQRAYLAGRFAYEFAEERNDIDNVEVQTAALLHDIAEIMIACHAPKLHSRIHSMQQADKNLRSKTAQKVVFGFSFDALEMALIEKWNLPRILQALIDTDHEDSPRVRTVRCACSTARHVSRGWDDAGLPDDYRDAGEICKNPAEIMRNVIREITLAAAKDWGWYGTPPAASSLIQFQ